MHRAHDADIKEIMSQAKFYEGYSRWSEDLNRYETWEEAVTRVLNMHREYYKDKMTPELSRLIDEAESLYKLKYVLGAQRALQFGGDQLLKHQMRMYNCFSADTSFLTRQGIKSFDDFNHGDTVEVKTHKGHWKSATVKNYGKQALTEITFRRKGSVKKVKATANHRWILKDGTETTALRVGDKLQSIKDTCFDWVVDDITPIEGLSDVWCLEVEGDKSFILEGGILTGNCTSSYADRPDFFGEVFYILLCGAGVGFSVQKHHIAKLPKIAERKKQAKVHEVEDSIEGWADALSVLMSSYFVGGGAHKDYEGRKVYFDLSGVRPKGSEISGGFKAPGPDPLRRALDKIEYLLQGLVLKGVDRLSPIHVYDIVMFAADAVLAGGVRRSATICLFSPDDDDMINAKTGNWFEENPQRGRSNNSAVIVRDEITREEFSRFMNAIKQFGEPGFYFVDSKEHTTNPCVEIGMFPQIDGKSGWQGCNLTEINGSMCTNKEEFFKACRAGAILGTLQAGYTDFRYVSKTTKKIFDREALLGVSITGWMNNPDVLFDEEVQKEGAKIVKKVNSQVAKLIGINPAARTTCVKPSGNASVLLKTASGIHAEHAPRYLRHVQMNKDAEVAQLIAETNPYMVEESVWSANQSDFAIAFPIIAKEGSIYRKESQGIDFLEKVKKVQANWVEYGTNIKYCADPKVRHNVSNTCTVPGEAWDEIEEYVFKNRKYFSGISFLSDFGDKDFNQAPNAEVLTETQIVEKYGRAALFASGLIVDSHKGFANLWEAVSVAQYNPEQSGELSDLRAEWIRRFTKFADNYFDGDMRKAEYCLKDVHYLHKWTKIQQNLQAIDFNSQLNRKKFTDIDQLGAIACSGGSCEVNF